jgi:hypothetical protein
VELHGGQISAANAQPGLSVRIELPALPGNAEAMATHAAPEVLGNPEAPAEEEAAPG